MRACPPKSGGRRRGFTLLEILLAMVFVVAGLLPLLMGLSSSLLVSSESKSGITALNLSRSKLEEIKNLPYSSITSEAKAAVAGFTAFKRQVAVTSPNANLKDARVTVYWTSLKGDEESVSLETYVANF